MISLDQVSRVIRLGMLALSFLSFGYSIQAKADWEILPTSYYQLYETYGLYIDRQNTLNYYGDSRIWSAVGGTLPIYGDSDSPSHPQIAIVGTGNFGLYFTNNYRFYTQNIDARVGAAYEQAIDEHNRFEISIIHLSAHTADGVINSNTDIVNPGVGSEYLGLRFIHDFDNYARVGGEYRPFLRSDPKFDPWLSFSLFGEVFPFGASQNPHRGTLYLASGLEVGGPVNQVIPTYHVQLGVYWGNHMEKSHSTSLRYVVGYYNGADPRLKYFSLLGTRDHFYYFGMMFGL